MKIAKGSYKREDGYDGGIRGKGYIVSALEAALWAFWSDENSFEKGALLAVNLGDDTDTTAAIYGQLAGAYYGYNNLSPTWQDFVYAKDYMACLSKWIAFEAEKWTPCQEDKWSPVKPATLSDDSSSSNSEPGSKPEPEPHPNTKPEEIQSLSSLSPASPPIPSTAETQMGSLENINNIETDSKMNGDLKTEAVSSISGCIHTSENSSPLSEQSIVPSATADQSLINLEQKTAVTTEEAGDMKITKTSITMELAGATENNSPQPDKTIVSSSVPHQQPIDIEADNIKLISTEEEKMEAETTSSTLTPDHHTENSQSCPPLAKKFCHGTTDSTSEVPSTSAKSNQCVEMAPSSDFTNIASGQDAATTDAK
ncbi:unnamed protein product [Rotaria sp. Silwood2]|nr:unnamed protein product [Rotaria sp. Silwood2]